MTYLECYKCAEDLISEDAIPYVYSITKAPVFNIPGANNEAEELLCYYINGQWYHGDDVRTVTYDGSEKTICLEA